MKILGLITARGGSKGIPRKNVRSFAGKPLIVHTIEAAQRSGAFDRIILSTEDEEIAQIGKDCGVEVPFMRPAELATDTVSHVPVVQHVLAWLRDNEGYEPDAVMILQPTTPLRQPFHIMEACELLEKGSADSVLSVTPVPKQFSSGKLMTVQPDGRLTLSNGDSISKRVAQRQQLRSEYYSVGMIFLFKTALVLGENANFYGERTLPYVIEEKYTGDIDEPGDWEIAEEAFKRLHANGK